MFIFSKNRLLAWLIFSMPLKNIVDFCSLFVSFDFFGVYFALSLFFNFSFLRWTLSHCLETSSLSLILRTAFVGSCLHDPIPQPWKFRQLKILSFCYTLMSVQSGKWPEGGDGLCIYFRPFSFSVTQPLNTWRCGERCQSVLLASPLAFCTVPELSSCLLGRAGLALDTPLVSSLLQALRFWKSSPGFSFLP